MGKTWELDYYSKPILDEEGKKLWEVLICESPLNINTAQTQFRFSKFCPAAEVNSVWLGNAIKEAIAIAPAPPSRIRFFRRQMNNMITKACKDLGLDPIPSRRTISLHHWLQERMQNVYPNLPGFQFSAPTASVRLESPAPLPLPDALIGEQWAFVSLEAEAFLEMDEWEINFGEAFPILGEHSLAPLVTPQTPIPGLIIFSPRAIAVAGWMSGLDLAFLRVDTGEKPKLVLETGASDSWILANLTNSQTLTEAKGFAQALEKAQQVHFLAVQSDPKSESFAGFWLLQELNLA